MRKYSRMSPKAEPGITVLTHFDRISLFHTLKPVLFHKGRFDFKFTDSLSYCLEKDSNQRLVILRLPQKFGVDAVEALQKLQNKYRQIVFFNDGAAAGTINFDLLPYVDKFFVKSMLRDKGQYSKGLYRNRLFTDFYHRNYGVIDSDWNAATSSSMGHGRDREIHKIRLSWNIGVGDFPREDFRQRVGVFTARSGFPKLSKAFFRHKQPGFVSPEGKNGGNTPVHARLGKLPAATINHQRKLFIDKIGKDRCFITGRAAKKIYDKEMSDSLMTLSPFGWGEVCFRDFEAVFAGSLLLKPSMDHIDTWPDIYKPNETYVPLSWNGEDLFEKVEYYLAHARERVEIVQNAQRVYREAILQLPVHFQGVMSEAFEV